MILSPNEISYTEYEDSDVPDITCSGDDCQPDCTLMWITPAGEVISNEILSLKKIQRNQSGIYRCNASNAVGNMVSAGVTISVLCTYLYKISLFISQEFQNKAQISKHNSTED